MLCIIKKTINNTRLRNQGIWLERSEWACLLWFSLIEGIGSRQMEKIKGSFGAFASAYQASSQGWQERGWPEKIARKIEVERSMHGIAIAHRLLERVEAGGMGMICSFQPGYPDCLRQIANHPFILYYKGRLELLNSPAVAIVGSRRCTTYGRNTAEHLASGLSGAGITIVSGLARGIDAAAHTGALRGIASTIAVLGGGLDHIYPAENRRLHHQIASQGLLISDYPPGTIPHGSHFPARNRIIAGLSKGVLVVEAQQRSGSLITADFALEQGRDVMAVPGPINSPASTGSNNLIKQGARLVSSLEEILEETGLKPGNNQTIQAMGEEKALAIASKMPQLDSEQKKILKWLENGTLNMDELLALSGWDIGTLARSLLQLEITGLVKSRPGNYYIMSTDH